MDDYAEKCRAAWNCFGTNPRYLAELAARSSLKALFSKLVEERDASRTQGNKALNALIECGLNAGGDGFGEDITIEVPKAVSALRSEVERLTALETRVFQYVAMGEPITVEAFSDLALRRLSEQGA